MVFIQPRMKNVDMVDDRTGNGDDVDQEGIEGGRGHDGHGEESRPNVDVRLFPGLENDAPKSFSRDVGRKPLEQKS